jgi:transcriptional regulator with AAA-type ATPase domain/pSer/pThr/pTyr-binding forkhead associated (FHA) protein
MARLLFYRGPYTEGEAPLFVARLRQGRTRIGRVDDCDVVLPDDEVSRSHCVIDQQDGGWVLVDRSSNGTFRNGERVQRCVLQDGDLLRVGPFTVRVDLRVDVQAGPTEEAQPEQRHEEIVDAGEQLTVSEAWLTIASGPGEGRRFRLRGGRVAVGGFGSRVVLPDLGLVRDHVRVRLLHGRAMIEPGAGAAFLGPVRIRDILPLHAGEEVRIGATEFTVEWDLHHDTPMADRFGEMVGISDVMRRAFGMLRRMAAHHAPVLLIGESGTGKELAARALHDASPRSGRSFVALNCGAITASLFESELFGYEKGAFTGATERRDGAFHRADGGTLFLDEVGELPEEAQSKLLRALESGEVRRVGGGEPSFPDVRVVAATNRSLVEDSKQGGFRSDLYFRLAVLPVRLPALRERPEDIPVLAETIARRVHPELTITPGAMEALRAYAWPGNAREMRNVLTRAFVLYGPVIDAGCLIFNPLERDMGAGPGLAASSRNAIEEAEREVVLDALKRANGNRSQAARLLGIARSSLLYKLRRWGIEG